ncbi:MAG: M14 family metallopeptidase [Bacteroidota bacterium]
MADFFKKWLLKSGFCLLLFGMLSVQLFAQEVPKPADVFGFEPGADYELIDNDQLEKYYRALADASDRVVLKEIGETHRGNTLLLLIISSKENLANLDKYKGISQKLAKAKELSDDKAQELSKEGKTVVWIDSGLHSTELAHSQHNPVFAYKMATSESAEFKQMRDEVILLNMPMMNPDGHNIVVDWYRQQKDTEFANTNPPEVYHEYIGHDNNRDWYMMLQNESQAVSNVLYKEWFPQIVVNHHQMGEMPPRMFIPPFANPINPNIPAMAVRGTNLVGEHMANRFAGEGKSGVIQGITFNMWWNGGMRTVPYFHNMVGILTESTHSSPIPKEWDEDDIPEKIVRGGNEISMEESSIFYPDPWEGGTASMKQMVDYHLTASMGVMDIAVKRQDEWLYNMYQMGRDAIEKGQQKDPYAYVISPDQWDRAETVNMLKALQKGGIQIHRATSDFEFNGETYPEDSYVIYTSQAFRPYLIDLMEPQFYPDRRLYPDGPPEPPYDMAGWTLPIQMGVDVDRLEEKIEIQTKTVDKITPFEGDIDRRVEGYVLSSRSNMDMVAVNRLLQDGHGVHRLAEGTDELPAGSFYVKRSKSVQNILKEAADEFGLQISGVNEKPSVELMKLNNPRVGIYQSWTASMDEGWTRWIFDNYDFDYSVLHDSDLQNRDLDEYDIIILPSMSASRILNGHEQGTMPKEYVGGLGIEGTYQLKKFVETGGTVVGWEGATDFLINQFGLPVEDALANVAQDEFFIPGSLIKMKTDNANPQAYGVEEDHAGFFLGNSKAFSVVEPAEVEGKKAEGPPVEVFSWYEDEDLLLSGWALGEEEHLAGKPAALRVGLGDGEVVLVGFRPQLRAQSRATFKFLFNPIFNSASGDLSEISEWTQGSE